MKAVRKLRGRVSPTVYCGAANHVCDRRAVARSLRDQAKVAAIGGRLAWR